MIHLINAVSTSVESANLLSDKAFVFVLSNDGNATITIRISNRFGTTLRDVLSNRSIKVSTFDQVPSIVSVSVFSTSNSAFKLFWSNDSDINVDPMVDKFNLTQRPTDLIAASLKQKLSTIPTGSCTILPPPGAVQGVVVGLAFSGYSGFSGVSGRPGRDGTVGIDGVSGFSGYSGISGLGVSGFSGYSGVSGYSGYSGISGYSGYSGVSGYSGYSGVSGYFGVSGYSGYSGISGIGSPAFRFYINDNFI